MVFKNMQISPASTLDVTLRHWCLNVKPHNSTETDVTGTGIGSRSFNTTPHPCPEKPVAFFWNRKDLHSTLVIQPLTHAFMPSKSEACTGSSRRSWDGVSRSASGLFPEDTYTPMPPACKHHSQHTSKQDSNGTKLCCQVTVRVPVLISTFRDMPKSWLVAPQEQPWGRLTSKKCSFPKRSSAAFFFFIKSRKSLSFSVAR